MNILVTGRGGSSGSWAIRGRQLGEAIGATVAPNTQDGRGFDLAIVVKRVRQEMLYQLQQQKIPLVWDIVGIETQVYLGCWMRLKKCVL